MKANIQLKVTKTFKGTWNGRKGESTDYLLNTRTGPRIVIHRWMDTQEVSIRAVTGDGQVKNNFKEFANIKLKNPTSDQLTSAVNICKQALQVSGLSNPGYDPYNTLDACH